MNGIQRVQNAINRIPGTPVPRGELVMDRSFMADFIKWRGIEPAPSEMPDSEMLIDCCRCLNLDLVCLQSDEQHPGDSDPLLHLSRVPRLAGAGLFVFWVVNGAFQTAMQRHDFMAFAMRLAREPETVGEEMKGISLGVIDTMKQGVTAGAHGIILADDIAYRESTYMAPAFAETYLLPLWREQVAAARALAVPVFFHSDGNINKMLPLLAAARFDGLQCIEPAANMDMGAVKQQYGESFCLMGNMDPSLLFENDPAGGGGGDDDSELTHAVKKLLAAAAPGGGFIFSTCSGLYAGMSPRKVELMFSLAETHDPASAITS